MFFSFNPPPQTSVFYLHKIACSIVPASFHILPSESEIYKRFFLESFLYSFNSFNVCWVMWSPYPGSRNARYDSGAVLSCSTTEKLNLNFESVRCMLRYLTLKLKCKKDIKWRPQWRSSFEYIPGRGMVESRLVSSENEECYTFLCYWIC